MEIQSLQNLSIGVSGGTLVALGIAVWKVSSYFSNIKSKDDDQDRKINKLAIDEEKNYKRIRDLEHKREDDRVAQAEMRKDIKFIRETIIELKKKLEER